MKPLGHDERRVLTAIERRLRMGEKCCGPLRIANVTVRQWTPGAATSRGRSSRRVPPSHSFFLEAARRGSRAQRFDREDRAPSWGEGKDARVVALEPAR